MAKQHWLVKSEPASYAWESLVKDGGTAWTGVRNFAARLHLRAMKPGDLVLFYHSVTDKAVVGIATVSRAAYPDPTAEEGDWSAVDLKPGKSLRRAVTLEQIRTDPVTREIPLIRQSRLSVMPIGPDVYRRIVELGI
ncbi:MAG: EVE domain-containing protein [Verrucomicrobia bacterium]|nr:MAG: EVE domain-containing protein [Verrucomicrobiota bacterium]